MKQEIRQRAAGPGVMVSGVDPDTMAILERVSLFELTLFSKRARSNSPAFLAGWVLALSIVGAVVLVLAGAGKVSAGGRPSTLSYVVHLLLGLLLLFPAARK